MVMDFASYRKVYHKAYSSYAELMRRTNLFYSRLMRVFAVGVKYVRRKSSSFLRLNEWSDRTEQERMDPFTNSAELQTDDPASVKAQAKSEQPATPKEQTEEKKKLAQSIGAAWNVDHMQIERIGPKLPTREQLITEGLEGQSEVYLDYRQSNCITPIKDQKDCGACYLFSMVTLYEYHYCKQSQAQPQQQQVQFSEQYGIDCGKRELQSGGMNGCDGGRDDHVVFFVANYGLELESRLPFKQQEDTCPYEPGTDKSRMGQVRVKHTQVGYGTDPDSFEPGVFKYVLDEFGPFALSIYVDKDLIEYGGGIDMMSSCVKPYGHAMSVIGYGVEEGHEYFLVKNSSGSEWGEGGYYRLSKHFNKDCVKRFAYIQVEFS